MSTPVPISSLSPEEQLQTFRLLMEHVTDYAILLFDVSRRVVYWNRGAERLLGYGEADIMGQSSDIIFTPEDREKQAPDQEMNKALTEGRAEDERWHMRKDGSRFWGSGVVTALRDEAGQLRWYVKILRDLTSRQMAEKQLEAAYANTREILESISDAFYTVDRSWRLTYVNAQAERLWHRTREQLLGRVVWEMFPDYESSVSYQMHQRAMEEQQPVHFETFASNLQMWIGVSIYPSASGLSVYFRDITERKQTEARMQTLTQETAILEERTRMARELHDTLAQSFTAIKLQLEAAEDALQQEPADANRYLVRAREVAYDGLLEARRAVRAMRTAALDGRSLEPALQWMLDQVTQGTGIQVVRNVEGAAYSLPERIEDELYRIAQEGLTNALRHAAAQQITLTLTYTPTDLQLRISDNGQGFETQTHPQGFGLQGMRERAARIGAQFTLNSHPGDGTDILVTLPTAAFRHPRRH